MPEVFRHFLKPGIGSLSLVYPSGTRSRPGIVSSAHRMRRKGREMYFDQVEFGKRVRKARRAKELTQSILAELLGVDRTHITKIENGGGACSIDLLVELSGHLGVTTDYLLTGRDADYGGLRQRLADVIDELSQIKEEI